MSEGSAATAAKKKVVNLANAPTRWKCMCGGTYLAATGHDALALRGQWSETGPTGVAMLKCERCDGQGFHLLTAEEWAAVQAGDMRGLLDESLTANVQAATKARVATVARELVDILGCERAGNLLNVVTVLTFQRGFATDGMAQIAHPWGIRDFCNLLAEHMTSILAPMWEASDKTEEADGNAAALASGGGVQK